MENITMVNIKIEGTRKRLIDNLERLIKNCQYEVDSLKENKDYKPNSLGIIQYNSIDTECARLYALHEVKKLIESEE